MFGYGLFYSPRVLILASVLLAVLLSGTSDRSVAGAGRYDIGYHQTNSNSKQKKKPKVVKPTMNKPQNTTVALGNWGGNGIRLAIESKSSSIEYDCAQGEITEILTTDQNGNFNAKGFHARQHGGPIRDNEPDNRQPARYTGRISGDQMTLQVTLVEKDTPIGDFQLERGKNVRLHKCL